MEIGMEAGMDVGSRRTSVAGVAATLVAATAVVMAPRLAAPAHAGTQKAWFERNDLIKINTTWGDSRYSLNLGGPQGSTTDGRIAQIMHDALWDNASRFVVDEDWPESSLHWHMLRNNHSQMCLAADVGTYTYVVQHPCDASDPAQWWTGQWGFGPSAWIRNLQHHRWGLDTVMSQRDRESDGSPIVMQARVPDHSRQDWYLESCLVNGVQQASC